MLLDDVIEEISFEKVSGLAIKVLEVWHMTNRELEEFVNEG